MEGVLRNQMFREKNKDKKGKITKTKGLSVEPGALHGFDVNKLNPETLKKRNCRLNLEHCMVLMSTSSILKLYRA